MRAVVHGTYGPPEVLRIEEVERPLPKEDEVLVKVHATTVNRTHTGFRSAEYFLSRFFTGRRRPKQRILRREFAGAVEAVRAGVTEFALGDRVFGIRCGERRVRLRAEERFARAHAGGNDVRGGCGRLRRRDPGTGVVRWLGTADEDAVSLENGRRAGFYPADYRLTACEVEHELREGDRIRVGELEVEVLETPGHSDGHLAYGVELDGRKAVLRGDLVFYGG